MIMTIKDALAESIVDNDSAAGAGVLHRQCSPHYDILGDAIYLPVNHDLVRGLLGRVLTHLDMMGLTDRTRRAAKTLITQDVWRWWGEAYENATTSYQGCIAPVICPREVADGPSNRWGWPSEDAYLKSRPADDDE